MKRNHLFQLTFVAAAVIGCSALSGCGDKTSTAQTSSRASQDAEKTAAAQADLYKQGKIGSGGGGASNANRYAPGGGAPIPGGGGPPIPGGGAPPGPPIPGGGPPR